MPLQRMFIRSNLHKLTAKCNFFINVGKILLEKPVRCRSADWRTARRSKKVNIDLAKMQQYQFP